MRLSFGERLKNSFIEYVCNGPCCPNRLSTTDKQFVVPTWIRSKLFQLEEPLFISRLYDDANYIRMLYQTPAPFRARNIFVKREGLERI